MKNFTATQIAQIINGTIQGNADVLVSSFGKIEEATSNQITFLANPKYEDFLYNTQAAIVIINSDLVLKENISSTLIRVPNAYSAFATLLTFYSDVQKKTPMGMQQPVYISTTATIGQDTYIGCFSYIGDDVVIGKGVKIYPGCFIGNNVTIGDNVSIYPNVVIYHNCKIGNHVVIHAGTIIGADGFGFVSQEDGTYSKIPQIGNVIIEDYVEIGSNTTIDRATMGSTIIKKGVKLDNLIQIAHNVEIGADTVIAAQSGISGSTKVGKNVMIGGQVGIVGHLQIADNCKIGAQSGVSKSILECSTSVFGTPANHYNASLRSQAVIRNLPNLEKRIVELEKLSNYC